MSLLALFNPSKAFLAVAAVLSGYCLFRFYAYTAGNVLVVPYLLVAGAFLGMADSAWRLIFTTAAETEKFPDDLPAGTVSPTASYYIAAFLTLAGLMCAMTAGFNAFRAAGIMIILFMARSALFRNTEVVTPILKGLGFGMFFVLGTTAHPSFMEMIYIAEIRTPAAFFTFYIIIAAVLSQVRDSAKPRAVPPDEELSSVTASRLLEMRDEAIDSLVPWIAGGLLFVIPLVLGWIISFHWLSWTIFGFLSLTTLGGLVPVLVYRTRKDLGNFIESVYRGGALLNAGSIACMGDYQIREVYEGLTIPLPGRDELVAIVFIVLLTIPAWVLRRAAPVD